jgi:DNA uptake protein ComE-like DNA-binding protein
MRNLTKFICACCIVTVAWTSGVFRADSADNSGESGQSATHTVAGTKVDVNRASAKELSRLPGMTNQTADRIIRNRPYRKLDDLVTRKVLGKKQFAQIKELIVAGQNVP